VRHLLVQPDGGVVFVAVIFSGRIGRETDRAILGRVLPDGAWDSTFGLVEIGLPLLQMTGPFWFNDPENQPSVGAPPPFPAAFLVQQPDGVLVLAGAFDTVNSEPRRRLARLEPDGALRGVFGLGIASGALPRLIAPGEVEAPYVVETSVDLQTWAPWRTNASPWQGWSEAVPTGNPRGFFRAVGRP